MSEGARHVAEIDLAVTGMTCAACAARVEKKLNKLQGVKAAVNLATEKAHVELEPEAAHVSNEQLIAVVEKSGYGAYFLNRVDIASDGTRISHAEAEAAKAVEAAAGAAKTQRVQDLWRRFWVSLALSVPIVSISMIPALQFAYWQWLVGGFALIVSIYCAWPFHRAAARAAWHGSSTMDTLVSLGVIASIGWSVWAVALGGAGGAGYRMAMSGMHKITGSAGAVHTADAVHSAGAGMAHLPHVYFESAAMIITFVLLGRWLEARSRRSAGDALQELLHLGADHAYLVAKADGRVLASPIIPASELQVGDIFRVKPGEKVAADGVVVSGATAIDASIVTGESVPVEVALGDSVTGGSLNTYGTIDVRATRVGEETTLAHMGRLLAQAQTGKAPVQRLADKISSIFVPAVLGIAVVDLIVRLAVAGISGGADGVLAGIEPALASAIAVLVVACPCALGLATPTALLIGSGTASRQGIFMRGPEILERAHQVSVALLDKTGTLTEGAMRVSDVAVAGLESAQRLRSVELLRIAAAVEMLSEHPIAQAIVKEAAIVRGVGEYGECVTGKAAESFRAVSGYGAEAKIDGLGIVRVGKESWLQESGFTIPHDVRKASDRFARSGATVVMVGVERVLASEKNLHGSSEHGHKNIIGAIAVGDMLRAESPAAVAQMKALGIEPMIISGDTQAVADAVGTQLGIKARGGILPHEKVDAVRRLQGDGEKVLMVGDGVNDAAALAAADLSVAVGAGTDVAKAAADITIMNSDPLLIPAAVRISKRTLRIIKQNLAWAFGYNLVAIPLALFGIIAPSLAGAAMASSSVIVVANSLRLRNAV